MKKLESDTLSLLWVMLKNLDFKFNVHECMLSSTEIQTHTYYLINDPAELALHLCYFISESCNCCYLKFLLLSLSWCCVWNGAVLCEKSASLSFSFYLYKPMNEWSLSFVCYRERNNQFQPPKTCSLTCFFLLLNSQKAHLPRRENFLLFSISNQFIHQQKYCMSLITRPFITSLPN